METDYKELWVNFLAIWLAYQNNMDLGKEAYLWKALERILDEVREKLLRDNFKTPPQQEEKIDLHPEVPDSHPIKPYLR